MKGQDVVVLSALLGITDSQKTLPALSETLHLSVATVHRSMKRLQAAGLLDEDRNVRLAQADEFFTHALQYLFPPRFHGESRGVPTAWAAPPLRDELTTAEGPPSVWPHPEGGSRGIALDPLHEVVPDLALRDAELYERLALVDALRIGDARIRNLALDGLRGRYHAR
jgi:Winged helix-turn-helix DNA-binding